ncbi:MAG: hypothetical protein PHX93_01135 [Candidatus Peribacteraceae bacterium]|jgi:hypothetical protein|nr:hypothetical protein [Candidatus Peribacteraceae bacterium]
MSDTPDAAKMNYLDGHVTRVEDARVEITDTTEKAHVLHYPQAKVRFSVGQVLHVRVHKDGAGQMAIDAIV